MNCAAIQIYNKIFKLGNIKEFISLFENKQFTKTVSNIYKTFDKP